MSNNPKITALKARMEAAEGRIAWLYRDSSPAGLATCGIGHQVPDLDHANALLFAPPITAREWHALMTSPRGCRASYYQAETEGRLTDAGIDALFDADLLAVLTDLRLHIAGFDALPDGPQAALADMRFNLGMAGLLKYSRLLAAVKSGNWQACADECHRAGISEARNQETVQLFCPTDPARLKS